MQQPELVPDGGGGGVNVDAAEWQLHNGRLDVGVDDEPRFNDDLVEVGARCGDESPSHTTNGVMT
jgi:hypothetical protein